MNEDLTLKEELFVALLTLLFIGLVGGGLLALAIHYKAQVEQFMLMLDNNEATGWFVMALVYLCVICVAVRRLIQFKP